MLYCARICAYGIILSTAACTPRLCDERLSPTGRYSAQILDLERENGQFRYNPLWTAVDVDSTGSCAGLDGMVVSSSVELRAIGTNDDPNHTCRRIVVSVLSLPSPTVLLSDNPQPPARFAPAGPLFGGADVTIGDCPGQVFLEIFAAAPDPYAAPLPGDDPPAVLYRVFVPSAACLRVCDDNFAVQLTHS